MARDTRERILDTALAQFAARGVEAVAVTDLEEGAGLKPGSGSFYRHFRSKDDVLAAVVDREVERAEERREVRPSRELGEEYTAALAALDALRPLVALLVRDGARLPRLDRVRAVLAEGGVRLDADRLQERMDTGEVPARDAVAVAAVVQMALVGHHLAEQFFGAGLGVDRDRFVAALADLVRR
ncbi:MAG TPA: helix-turn-helix domain-containing protein [Mycobacteriales bacterium]|nr:helix-turn-helix domain-containing protein [Mycobacteriales bacterium]